MTLTIAQQTRNHRDLLVKGYSHNWQAGLLEVTRPAHPAQFLFPDGDMEEGIRHMAGKNWWTPDDSAVVRAAYRMAGR